MAGARRREERRSEDKGEARRVAIVGAATELFSRYGFRRTSVDRIAQEAGVAKPTVYAYFADKDAVFRAVVEAVLGAILAEAELAAAGPGPLEERLLGVLAAKFTRLFELVHASPHAAEILQSQGRLSKDVELRTDRAFARIVGGLLEDAAALGEIEPARAGLGLPGLTQALLRCGHGAGYGATSAATHKRHLAELVRAVLAGVRRPAR